MLSIARRPASFVVATHFGDNWRRSSAVQGERTTLIIRNIDARFMNLLDAWFPHGTAHYLLGGALIGCGIGLLYLLTGFIGGTSTFFTSSWSYLSRDPYFRQSRWLTGRAWRLAYSLGLIAGAALFTWAYGEPWVTGIALWQLLVGGFLIGFGARLAKGCTAGHGICGLASLQLPSLLAVLTFMASAIGVAQLLVHVQGP